MEFKSQTNQPAASRPAPAPVERAPQQVNNSGNGGRKLLAVIITAVVVLALVIAAAALWYTKGGARGGDEAAVDPNKYQAVFMTNGQVYFGHLSSLEGEYVELTNIYYLQVQQDVQPSADKQTEANSKVSLTKLGSELHGPTDKMNISKDQILFWEDLKDDSSVVKAINDHKKN